jgi:nucleotide-binding universal stress UspA family protein
MPAFKNIVVATDFGDIANHATVYAVELARELGARVTLFHAYEMPLYAYADGAMLATEDLVAGLSTTAESTMGELVALHRSKGVAVEAVVRLGAAADEVTRFADEIHADLIIVGTHGRRGLARALLGSVAEIIVRTSARPVLVVPFPETQ